MSFLLDSSQAVPHYISTVFPKDAPLCHGFATKLGGVSENHLSSLNLGRSRDDEPAHVRENFQRFMKALNCETAKISMCQQIHSDKVFVVEEKDTLADLYDSLALEGDGLITNSPHVALTIFYADCIPLLFFDPVKKVIAAVHSGWRGTAKCIAVTTAKKMLSHFGSKPEDILVAIGPGICPRHFETHRDVPDAMEEILGKDFLSPFVLDLENGKFQVDLKGIIRESLLDFGLMPENIDQSDICTSCRPLEFWSHRTMGEARGNQAAMIALCE